MVSLYIDERISKFPWQPLGGQFMKDVTHHLKCIQKKVIREARKNNEETLVEKNGKPVHIPSKFIGVSEVVQKREETNHRAPITQIPAYFVH
ncbi:hypothetical protein BN1013_01877 [Candidatus Rubidus massiliensis]|nr:hypothetical protein BN1013_01877 [Candidatus Rubidus massiliensis]